MTLTQLTVDKFIEITASGEPVPGGGSISALCGALASALGQMVGRLTIGKKKYAEVQNEVEEIIDRLAPICDALTRAIDLDSEAYDHVFQAYKLPKETDEQKATRSAAIQEALKHAAMVPLSVATATANLLPDLERLATIGNQNAITDAYVASLCARTAIYGACANTRINLSSITDAEFVADANSQVATLERMGDASEQRMRSLVTKAF